MCIILIILTVMQLSLAPVGTDKFSKLLQNCHNSLAALLEVSSQMFLCLTYVKHVSTSVYTEICLLQSHIEVSGISILYANIFKSRIICVYMLCFY